MLLFWTLLQVAGPVTLFRVAWCVTLLFTGCSFWCCAGYGWCCQPVSPMSRLVSGSILTLDFNAFQTLRLECVGYIRESALILFLPKWPLCSPKCVQPQQRSSLLTYIMTVIIICFFAGPLFGKTYSAQEAT